ncbi:uncharacterized protein LOC131151294 [Malania oleifera]|uniref:uncharacterized protein LOC131151294 n=1 Tax=Malania oleifera TaxID=397392 RepID=UPI0025ADD236|nr:uncharacterized protein LOC131151294 [Malania oleifera]
MASEKTWMDPRDEDLRAEGRYDLETSSEEDIDTSTMLRGIARQQIKEILEVHGCTDEQKVHYAAFKMAGDAKHWWLSVKLLKEQRLVKIALTWDRFKELFFDRYFPLSIREEKIEEFTNLTQGNMTVGEYAAKFVELSRFASFLILNKVRKTKKFEKGLRERLYELVVGFQVQKFSDLVDKALMLKIASKAAQSR